LNERKGSGERRLLLRESYSNRLKQMKVWPANWRLRTIKITAGGRLIERRPRRKERQSKRQTDVRGRQKKNVVGEKNKRDAKEKIDRETDRSDLMKNALGRRKSAEPVRCVQGEAALIAYTGMEAAGISLVSAYVLPSARMRRS
jgi:hypothetical protein